MTFLLPPHFLGSLAGIKEKWIVVSQNLRHIRNALRVTRSSLTRAGQGANHVRGQGLHQGSHIVHEGQVAKIGRTGFPCDCLEH